jgi:hypothetical protein
MVVSLLAAAAIFYLSTRKPPEATAWQVIIGQNGASIYLKGDSAPDVDNLNRIHGVSLQTGRKVVINGFLVMDEVLESDALRATTGAPSATASAPAGQAQPPQPTPASVATTPPNPAKK